MNEDCLGLRFTFNGLNYYRCQYDPIVPGTPSDGQSCPNCKRPIAACDIGEAAMVRSATVKVRLSNGDFVDMPVDQPRPVFDFHDCERGNIWLNDDDGNHAAWFRLPGENHWLEISLCPGNYPGLNVNTITITDARLAIHIRKKCDDWWVHKCNLDGVEIKDDHIVGIRDEELKNWIVTVEQVVELLNNLDDRHERPAGPDGLHSTREYTVTGVTEDDALNEFHNTIPIRNLEEFEITAAPAKTEDTKQDAE